MENYQKIDSEKNQTEHLEKLIIIIQMKSLIQLKRKPVNQKADVKKLPRMHRNPKRWKI